MNKRIDFTKVGGFPLVQESLGWMQDSYRLAIAALTRMAGDKVIVTGCEIAGGNVTDGWVIINGELMPFIGSAYADGDEVIVTETKTEALFGDGVPKEVYIEKQARIGSPGGFPFTDLVSIENHCTDDQNPHNTTLQQVGYNASDNPDENDPLKLASTVATKVLADRIIVVYAGIFNIGDVPDVDTIWTVNHNQNIQGNYMIIGSWKSNSNYTKNNKMPVPCWFNITPDSFQFSVQEISGEAQDIALSYILVKY